VIFFRADGNSKIGAGHIMRCLSIASAAVSSGEEVIFYTSTSDFKDKIESLGIKNVVLNSDFTNMESEIGFFKNDIVKNKPKTLFVDSYYVTKEYLLNLKEICHSIGSKLVYIDDVAVFAYPCDCLINYNLFAEQYNKIYRDMYKNEGVNLPTLLLGVEYVPLRKEFTNLENRKVRSRATDILVSTGGADTEHIALSFAKYIDENYTGNLKFHIVIGAMSKDREAIEALAEKNEIIMTYFDVRDMVSLMQSCDMAISAAGSTLYELCATQTPTITYVVADNQIVAAEYFEKAGVMIYEGDIRLIDNEEMMKALLERTIKLCDDYTCRLNISKIQKKYIDGNGANNIILNIK